MEHLPNALAVSLKINYQLCRKGDAEVELLLRCLSVTNSVGVRHDLLQGHESVEQRKLAKLKLDIGEKNAGSGLLDKCHKLRIRSPWSDTEPSFAFCLIHKFSIMPKDHFCTIARLHCGFLNIARCSAAMGYERVTKSVLGEKDRRAGLATDVGKASRSSRMFTR